MNGKLVGAVLAILVDVRVASYHGINPEFLIPLLSATATQSVSAEPRAKKME